MKLTTLLILLSFAAAAQTVVWDSPPLKTPLIRGNRVITNDSTVAVLYGLEAKAGYKYTITETLIADSVLVAAASYTDMSGIINSSGVLGGVDKTDWVKYTVNFKKKYNLIYCG